jgi:hypothetical protein
MLKFRHFIYAFGGFILLVGTSPATAAAAATSAATGRTVALVNTVAEDPALGRVLPQFYSRDTLTREMADALEATGLFTVPTRDPREINAIIAETRVSGMRGPKAARPHFIIMPVLTAISLDARERAVPHIRAKVLYSVSGSASLSVTVIDTTDGVTNRMSLQVDYRGSERMSDGNPSQPLGDEVIHHDPGPVAFVDMCRQIGRAFARRVLNQVSPAVVAGRDGNRIYLTRGEDSGYVAGQVLQVIRPGVDIFHPVTHEKIGSMQREIGSARVVEVLPKMTIAEIVTGGSEIANGDIVRDSLDSEGN